MLALCPDVRGAPFCAHVPLPEPAADGLFTDPSRITGLLSGTGWRNVQVTGVTEPARVGSDVERVLAGVAGEYAARQRPDGIWVRAAAWLVTARRAARLERNAAVCPDAL